MILQAWCGFENYSKAYIVIWDQESKKGYRKCKFIVTDLNKKEGCGFYRAPNYSEKLGQEVQSQPGTTLLVLFTDIFENTPFSKEGGMHKNRQDIFKSKHCIAI